MENKTILVTGGTAGIGLETAKTLAAQGNTVIVTGRDEEKLRRVSIQSGIQAFRCDSGNPAEITALAEQLKQADITLDGLVLNAGVFFPQPIGDISADDINHTFAINAAGPLLTLQSLLPMLKNPASVVMVSSVVLDKTWPSTALYTASKAALEAIASVASVELAGRGIRINTVRPGVTLTEIQAKAGMSENDIAALAEGLSSTPLGRALVADDLVPAITFLLSDGSLPMRNAVMTVDGGVRL